MIILILLFSFIFLQSSNLLAKELSLKDFFELALKNNLELKAYKEEVRAAELKKEAAKGAYFPTLKLEEFFYRSDIPAQVFTFKLNQEKFTERDFEIKRLNDPSARSNFETRVSIELPIWLGGRIQAEVKGAEAHLKAISNLYERKEEEILYQVYQAYLFGLLSKESIKVSESSVREAQENLKIARARYEAGTALLSDVKRAEVYLSKAEESLVKAKNLYALAKKRLEVLVNTQLGEFEIKDLEGLPSPDVNQVKEVAFSKRKDLSALKEEIEAKKASYRAILSENLPQITAFGSYFLNDKNQPFGSEGSGYLFGLGLSWKFDTGLSVLKRAQAELKQVKALEERYNSLKEMIGFEIERAYTNYLNALEKLKSAEARISASEEVLRTMRLRYLNGLVRMLDLLDAQTQLDLARYEKIEALKEVHEAYAELLLAGGILKEAL